MTPHTKLMDFTSGLSWGKSRYELAGVSLAEFREEILKSDRSNSFKDGAFVVYRIYRENL